MATIKKRKTRELDESLITSIHEHHSKALNLACDSIREAAACGADLIEARECVGKEGFKDWIDTTCPFSYRTGYRYIKVRELELSGALKLDSVSSINEALRLADKKEKTEKDKDERMESFVSHALKIQNWFNQETDKLPLKEWPPDRRKGCKDLLKGVRDIYEKL